MEERKKRKKIISGIETEMNKEKKRGRREERQKGIKEKREGKK